MKEKFINWLLKLLFYWRFLVLKRGNPVKFAGKNVTFLSNFLLDNAWKGSMTETSYGVRRDWVSIKRFQYGRFYFRARLDGIIENYWPAIWLLEIGEGNSTYYRIDIELFATHFGLTVRVNENGYQDTARVYRSCFANRKFFSMIKHEFHLYLIDWNEKRIEFSLDGLLIARFRDVPKVPMQIILNKLSLSRCIVEKPDPK